MALDQSALLEVLQALNAVEVDDWPFRGGQIQHRIDPIGPYTHRGCEPSALRAPPHPPRQARCPARLSARPSPGTHLLQPPHIGPCPIRAKPRTSKRINTGQPALGAVLKSARANASPTRILQPGSASDLVINE